MFFSWQSVLIDTACIPNSRICSAKKENITNNETGISKHMIDYCVRPQYIESYANFHPKSFSAFLHEVPYALILNKHATNREADKL